MLGLRRCLGIQRAIVTIGKEATTVSPPSRISCVVSFLRKLGVSVVYRPTAGTIALCRSLPSPHWILTKNRILFQLVTANLRLMVPDIAGAALEVVTVESLRSTFGLRPIQMPSFLSLTGEGGGGQKALFTKRQAIRLLEVYETLPKLLQALRGVPSHAMRRKLSTHADVLLRRLGSMVIEESVSPPVGLVESEGVFLKDDHNTAETLREYGFWSVVRLLPQSVAMHVPAVNESTEQAGI